MVRWETDARYYAVDVHQDLFGDWVVLQYWGGKFNKLGSQSVKLVSSYIQACELIKQLHTTRIKRGYQLTKSKQDI